MDEKKPETKLANVSFDSEVELEKIGIAEADYELGLKYLNGDGVKKNYAKGTMLLEKAAPQGLAKHQYMMAMLYTDHRIPVDLHKALKWFHKAAEQGHFRSQEKLGSVYDRYSSSGWGVDANDDKAFYWHSLAAKNGQMRSQFVLAEIYKYGRGVPVSNEKAVKWYLKSAEQGYFLAMHELATMYEYGDGVDRDFSIAFEWYRKAAKKGHVDAKSKVAYMLEKDVGYVKGYLPGKGLCTSINSEKDENWYKEAAAQGYIEAMFILGNYFENADVNEKGLYCKKQAFFFFRLAAYGGHLKSQIATAEYYLQGYSENVRDGVDEDVSNRFDINDGSELGQVQALKWLIIAKKSDEQVNTDLVRAEMRPEAIAYAEILAGEWKINEGDMGTAEEPSPFSYY